MSTDPTLEWENELFAEGFSVVLGIDEVGRGAVAGPVVVGISALGSARSEFPKGLRDSKLISESKREALIGPVSEWVDAIEYGESSALEVDTLGIIRALSLAGERALRKLHARGVPLNGSVMMLDGSHNWLKGADLPAAEVRVRPKADRDCALVAAASVWAKVHRDRLMIEWAQAEPRFGWDRNKGYGSAGHFEAIAEFGPHPEHRVTWLTNVLGDRAHR